MGHAIARALFVFVVVFASVSRASAQQTQHCEYRLQCFQGCPDVISDYEAEFGLKFQVGRIYEAFEEICPGGGDPCQVTIPASEGCDVTGDGLADDVLYVELRPTNIGTREPIVAVFNLIDCNDEAHPILKKLTHIQTTPCEIDCEQYRAPELLWRDWDLIEIEADDPLLVSYENPSVTPCPGPFAGPCSEDTRSFLIEVDGYTEDMEEDCGTPYMYIESKTWNGSFWSLLSYETASLTRDPSDPDIMRTDFFRLVAWNSDYYFGRLLAGVGDRIKIELGVVKDGTYYPTGIESELYVCLSGDGNPAADVDSEKAYGFAHAYHYETTSTASASAWVDEGVARDRVRRAFADACVSTAFPLQNPDVSLIANIIRVEGDPDGGTVHFSFDSGNGDSVTVGPLTIDSAWSAYDLATAIADAIDATGLATARPMSTLPPLTAHVVLDVGEQTSDFLLLPSHDPDGVELIEPLMDFSLINCLPPYDEPATLFGNWAVETTPWGPPVLVEGFVVLTPPLSFSGIVAGRAFAQFAVGANSDLAFKYIIRHRYVGQQSGWYYPYTDAHEIGHILTDADHFDFPHRLMMSGSYGNTLVPNPLRQEVIHGAKRLIPSEQSRIRTESGECLFPISVP